MNVTDLTARLGLRKSARSWRGACPACGYAAFSVRSGRAGHALTYCANGCDRDTLADTLRRITGGQWTAPAAPDRPDADADAARARKLGMALRLWDGGTSPASTIGAAYLLVRGLPWLTASPVLRFRGDTPHPEGGKLPALLALVQNAAGASLAVHRTFLAPDGRGKAAIEPQKASLGPVWGGAIRLEDADPARPLVIGEGIESSASAGRMIGAPAWAALSAGNLARGMVLPPAVRDVVIAADPDPAGERAAQAAAERWLAEGRAVRIALPSGGGDFNDALVARDARAVLHG